MSYAERGYSGPTLKIGALVATLVIGTFVTPHIKRYLNDQKDMTELSSPEAVDRELIADPLVGNVAKTMKQYFPGDYTALTTAIRYAAVGRDMNAIGGALDRQLDIIVQRDGRHAAQAPAPAMMSVAAAELRLLDSLSTANCVAFIKGTRIDGTPPPQRMTLVMDIAAARLNAIAQGRDHPVARKPPDAGLASDFLSALIDHGAPFHVQEVFAGERTLDQATDETVCEAQKQLLGTVQSMPGDSGARYFARYI